MSKNKFLDCTHALKWDFIHAIVLFKTVFWNIIPKRDHISFTHLNPRCIIPESGEDFIRADAL